MRRVWCAIIAVTLTGLSALTHGQDLKTDLQHKGEAAHIVATRFTADHTDIVEAGSVLVFHKRALVMFAVGNPIQATSVYQNGKLSMGFGTSLEAMKTGDNRVPQRTFVDGEKFWFAGMDVTDGAVFILVISDPYNDVRYETKLKFPFNKKSPPSADEMFKTISEVMTVDSGDQQNTAQQQQQPQQPAAPAPAAATLAPIAPPPPPADAPPPAPATITVGQTREVVVGILGEPQKVVKLGAKEIDIYPDLKITFINNKVSNVQ